MKIHLLKDGKPYKIVEAVIVGDDKIIYRCNGRFVIVTGTFIPRELWNEGA